MRVKRRRNRNKNKSRRMNTATYIRKLKNVNMVLKMQKELNTLYINMLKSQNELQLKLAEKKLKSMKTQMEKMKNRLKNIKAATKEKNKEMSQTKHHIENDQQTDSHRTDEKFKRSIILTSEVSVETVPVIPDLKETILLGLNTANWEECKDILLKNIMQTSASYCQLQSVINCSDLIIRAVIYGLTDLIAIFIKNGLSVNEIINHDTKETMLHYAARFGTCEVLKLLMTDNADLNALTVSKYTPLHFAANFGHLPVVQLLIKNGADLNVKSIKGRTALHLAARSHHCPVYSCLLLHCDSSITDCLGKTPLDYFLHKSL